METTWRQLDDKLSEKARQWRSIFAKPPIDDDDDDGLAAPKPIYAGAV